MSPFRFDDLEVVKGLRQRIETGAEWSQTEFYKRLLRQLVDDGEAPWGICSERDLIERCEYLDRLIVSIERHGYMLSSEVTLCGENKGVDGHPVYGSEITVNIGRDGQYLFQDGRHRLAIAKILGVQRVPVKVLVRHQEWVDFRQSLWALARGGATSDGSCLYQNPMHPDLQDIPYAHSCADRFAVLKESAGLGTGDVLDIGANLGFFCHGFEELGYNCFAVEHLREYAEAADKLRVAERRQFTIIADDLFAASVREPLNGRTFRIVLALNIFHHFLKEPDLFAKFAFWLQELRADTMYFEPHIASEAQMRGAFVNFSEDEFVRYILDHSVFTQAELIHRCSDGRPIYRLWRSAG
jgi:hypothetical protein